MDFFKTSEGLSRQNTVYILLLLIVIAATIVWWIRGNKLKDIKAIGPYDVGSKRKDYGSIAIPWMPVFSSDDAVLVAGNNTTASFFVYMNDEGTNRIFSPDDAPPNGLLRIGTAMEIVMNPIKNQCELDILQAKPREYETANVRKRGTLRRTIVVPDIFITKWYQFTICVEGRSVDVYVNGKLKTSGYLDNVPTNPFNGIQLNLSPDFSGQVCLVEMSPMRKSSAEILRNYERLTDERGRPDIPSAGFSFSGFAERLKDALCKSTGFCQSTIATGPLDYVDYEFA